ncbi:13721_t:CDS:10, partial [Entrophospora sp. SA101]
NIDVRGGGNNHYYDNDTLEEIKKYEDFTTIDWVQDAIHERSRLNSLRRTAAANGNRSPWSSWLKLSYEAGQAWIVVSIVGALIGLNAALIDIITEWLADIKMGYCKNSWWLNQKFCCWEIEKEDGSCEEWQNWSSYFIINWIFFIFFATLFAAACAHTIRIFAPYAAGSGISEIKCILAGFVMKEFLGGRTLLLKSIGLPLAIASGLSIGKEGPSVHTAACIGNVVSRLFGKYKINKAKMREITSASCAAGVAVAFGSPIGGVLFSYEEMSSNFPMKTMWRSFFCALVATVVLQAMNPFRTGKLVMFQVEYDRDWHFFEIFFFIILGIFGGLYGALVIRYNLMIQSFRKKFLLKDYYAVYEAAILASITALIGYLNIFMKMDMTETLGILFQECETKTHDYEGLCKDSEMFRMACLLFIATVLRFGFIIITYGTKVPADYEGLCKDSEMFRMACLLFIATVLRFGFIIITYGTKVPAGIFIPSMAVGATFGRFLGLFVKALYIAYPEFPLFASCKPDVPCVTPGMYAFLGAAAALGGVMHLTVCIVVIMFELTGALTYILPTMITLMVTKTVGDLFGKAYPEFPLFASCKPDVPCVTPGMYAFLGAAAALGGVMHLTVCIVVIMFELTGALTYILPTMITLMVTKTVGDLFGKEEYTFGVPVATIMRKNLTVMTASGLKLDEIERILSESNFQGFPVVQDKRSMQLLGHIGRPELKYAIGN